MEIAIRGHESRGKEVIQILESLGGRNTNWRGNGNIRDGFFINNDGSIEFGNLPKGYKLYTLEEFEKEFPFKIGDKVTIIGLPDYPKVITKMTWMNNEILYTFEDDTWYNTGSLRKLEMEEEKNIKLTLDKAKEWYKKGGELREIALQAFSEKELSPLPRSWEEFSYKYKICSTRYAMPSKYEALYQLEQLKNCWWNGWKPDWNDDQQAKYCVIYYHEGFKINILYETRRFLSFPTIEMAKEFLECFRDLIEKAEDLI